MSRRIVIGDVHGCFKTVKKLIESQIKPGKKDCIYFVGDLIDRGPKSKEVLDYLIDLKLKGFKILPVKGNHEDLFLRALNEDEFKVAWLRNGAEETLRSFGVPVDMFTDFKALRFIPEKYFQFIAGFPYYYDLKDYIIVHAGLNITSTDFFSNTHAMLWSREIKGINFLDAGICIIHGHTPIPLISLRLNLASKNMRNLNIDAGCVYKELPGYGMLVAFELDSRKLFVQENIDW